MAKKPVKHVMLKLRIRVELRDALRREGKRRGMTANKLAVERLEASMAREVEARRKMAEFKKQVQRDYIAQTLLGPKEALFPRLQKLIANHTKSETVQ